MGVSPNAADRAEYVYLAAASCFVFAAKIISLHFFNAELFKPTNEGYDGQEDDKSLKVSSCFGGPSVNAFNCWSLFVCVGLRVNRGGETTFDFLIQILILYLYAPTVIFFSAFA